MHIGNYQVMKDFVVNDLGVAFLYASSVEGELANGDLRQVHFKEALPVHEMFFIYRRENPAVEQIIRNFDLFEMLPDLLD